MKKGEWPYELGDDPSFYSAKDIGGPITWGVCRPDVRSKASVGDAVAFFAANFEEGEPTIQYYFVGALMVQHKVTHATIHRERHLAPLREYLNLLVRPKGDGWEHFEPSLPRSMWHDDWLWRIVTTRHLKADVVKASSAHRSGRTLEILGEPVTFADNYVVFATAPKRSVVLHTPVLVATFDRSDSSQSHECWMAADTAQRIKKLTLGKINARRDKPRWLRTSNIRQPHRHSRVEIRDSSAWMRQLRRALQS